MPCVINVCHAVKLDIQVKQLSKNLLATFAFNMKASNRIISLDISNLSYIDSVQQIVVWAKQRLSSYVCFANVHMTIEAYDNLSFQEQVNAANLVCADGMPLVKATQLVFKEKIDRVAGMDMMPSLMAEAEQNGLSVFFFGSTDEVLEKIENESRKQFPQLQIAGKFSPPFKKLSDEEKQQHRDLINESRANMIFVALGCPKQEKWMAENSRYINAVCLGVGGAFPVFAKLDKRAPEWMRNLSLEWLYRFAQEPRRLFKRYFYTNTKFLYLLMLNYFKKAA